MTALANMCRLLESFSVVGLDVRVQGGQVEEGDLGELMNVHV